MRTIKYIILHHSATDYQQNAEDTTGKVIARTICDRAQAQYKKDYPDYKCDYHFIIGYGGDVFKGQPVELPSWHCTNYQANLVSIGICFLGNFENIEMPTEQFTAGVNLIRALMRQYDVPLINVLRHRDIVSDVSHTANSTECPSKNFPYVPLLDALRDGEPFFDIGEDYPYIKEVKTLKELGIITGDGYGNLRPKEFITREEVMLLVYRVIKTLRH